MVYLFSQRGRQRQAQTRDLAADQARAGLCAAVPVARSSGLLLTILLTTGLGLLTPLIFRDLIDHTLPSGDTGRLNWLAVGLVLIPLVIGAISVYQRQLNASIGEGVIYDLRVACTPICSACRCAFSPTPKPAN